MNFPSLQQRIIEIRNDVLVYSTSVLEEDIQVTGPVKVIIYLSSVVKDTDITAKLVDVYPDGRAFNVTESIQRVRWRDGYENPTFMEKGEVYKVEISSSNFPRFARNLNTGGNNYDETDWMIAHNKVHHSMEYPSRVILSVVN